MRQIARHAFTLGSAVSLVLCVAALAVWLPGQHGTPVLRRGDGGFWGGGTRATFALFTHNGRVGLGWTYSDVWFDHTVSLPPGLLIVVNALLWVWWFALRPRQRGASGRCPSCGYDIRESPECGTPTAEGNP